MDPLSSFYETSRILTEVTFLSFLWVPNFHLISPMFSFLCSKTQFDFCFWVTWVCYSAACFLVCKRLLNVSLLVDGLHSDFLDTLRFWFHWLVVTSVHGTGVPCPMLIKLLWLLLKSQSTLTELRSHSLYHHTLPHLFSQSKLLHFQPVKFLLMLHFFLIMSCLSFKSSEFHSHTLKCLNVIYFNILIIYMKFKF